MTKHTKGPWSAPINSGHTTGYIWAQEPYGGIVATVAGHDFATPEERTANARLLAASPGLLSFLRDDLCDLADAIGEDHYLERRRLELIAEAELK